MGAFLRRDAGSPLVNAEEWKDTDGLPELYDYGTLAQIHAVYPTSEHTIMLLLGHRWGFRSDFRFQLLARICLVFMSLEVLIESSSSGGRSWDPAKQNFRLDCRSPT